MEHHIPAAVTGRTPTQNSARLPFLAAVLHRRLQADATILLADGARMYLWSRALAVLSPYFNRALSWSDHQTNRASDNDVGDDAGNDPTNAVASVALSVVASVESAIESSATLATGEGGGGPSYAPRQLDLSAYDAWSVRVLLHEALFPHKPRKSDTILTLAAYTRLHTVADALMLRVPLNMRLNLGRRCNIGGSELATVLRVHRGWKSADWSMHPRIFGLTRASAALEAIDSILGQRGVVHSIASSHLIPNGVVVNGSPEPFDRFEDAVRHAIDCNVAQSLAPGAPVPLRRELTRKLLPCRMWYDGLLGDVLVLLRKPDPRRAGAVGTTAIAGETTSMCALYLPNALVRYASPVFEARLRPLPGNSAEREALFSLPHATSGLPFVAGAAAAESCVAVVDCCDLDGDAVCFLLAHVLCGDGGLALATVDEGLMPRPADALRLATASACRVWHAARVLGVVLPDRYMPACVTFECVIYPYVGIVTIGSATPQGQCTIERGKWHGASASDLDYPAYGFKRAQDRSRDIRLRPIIQACALGMKQDAGRGAVDEAMQLASSTGVPFDFFADEEALAKLAAMLGHRLVERLCVGISMSLPTSSLAFSDTCTEAPMGMAAQHDPCELDMQEADDLLTGAPTAETITVVINDLSFEYDISSMLPTNDSVMQKIGPIDLTGALGALIAAWSPPP